MIELATAVSVAGLLDNAVSALDTVYNWWKERKGEPPARVELKADPKQQSFKYVRRENGGQTERVVLTYEQLAERISEDDVQTIKSFETRMSQALDQWRKLNAVLNLPEFDRETTEAKMDKLRRTEICVCLDEIIDLIDFLGIDLEDHYASARRMCRD
jgi:hypothetical protein